MATPSKTRNVVSKDSLRRLMKEKSAVGKSSLSRIDHPCAKYNALEQLTCVVCKTVIKNERLWNAHIMGRTHKEPQVLIQIPRQRRMNAFLAGKKDEIMIYSEKSNFRRHQEAIFKIVASLKHKAQNQNVPSPPVSQVTKRKSPDSETEPLAKKLKSNATSSSKNSLPDDFFDLKSKSKVKSQKPKSILKNATIRLPNYGESSGESESEEEATRTPADRELSGVPSGFIWTLFIDLSSDFFDSKPESVAAVAAPETKHLDPSMAEKLPEGFFDDPKQDAQVRQVEYKDKMEEEWELFQKAMKEQSTVSEQIQEEDDDLKTLERQVEEVDDQMRRWSQIHALAQKKESVMADKAQQDDEGGQGESSSDADEQVDDLMDWRSKSAYKS